MMIRNLTALRFLKVLPDWNRKTLVAKGGSQGALQATTVAAHDNDVTFLDISIPWFCNLAGYKDGRKQGWEGRIRGWSPDYTIGLCYFDTAVQATRVKCPVKIMARLGDYTCPPSGIMALYNNLNTKKEITFCQNGTHGYESPNHTKYTLKKLLIATFRPSKKSFYRKRKDNTVGFGVFRRTVNNRKFYCINPRMFVESIRGLLAF